MKVNIAKIKLAAGLAIKYAFDEQLKSFVFEGEEIKFKNPLEVSGEIVNTGDIFVVTGSAKTVLVIKCSRCLENFEYPLDMKFEALFSQYINPQSEDADEIRHFSGDEIILNEVIIEELLLELPLKFLCHDDCKGLCPQCGNNLNIGLCNCEKPIDPRLGILSNLLKVDE